MSIFQTLKQDAVDFLEPYKTREPATYAAAEQAIGAVLIADGVFGIDNPFGGKKRPGIFGAVTGMVLGIVFMFIPSFIGNISGINQMTASTEATVVSVGPASYSGSGLNSAPTCTLTAQYLVNGQQYSTQSSVSSSDNCSLISGQQVPINYNPAEPGAWTYKVQSLNMILKLFFWVGVLALVSSIITFLIRLFSIIFGWKLLKDGRKNAAALPPGTNLETMINEIKHNFTASVFGFGGSQPAPAAPQPTPLQNP